MTRSTRRSLRLAWGITLACALGVAQPTALALAQEERVEPSPTATAKPVPLDVGSRPVRVRVPHFDIDLPVVWSGRTVAGNPAGYPLCDVAQYLIDQDQGLILPGQPGTAWVYGHAQPGMFLPLTESWFAHGKSGLRGKLITLQLRDGRLLTYRISNVDVAWDYDIAERPNDRQQRLVLQTSTGATGASPRLMVAGRLIDAEWTDEPRPEPHPRACWQAPQATASARGGNRRQTPQPTPSPIVEASDPMDPMTLVLGSGAVLLGATVVAVYMVRRP
jgi:Sortase domain